MDYKFVNERQMDLLMTVLSTVATFMFGEFSIAMKYLIAANIVDVFTGIGKSGRYHKIGSRMFYSGVKKKIGFWVLVFVAHMVDMVIIGDGGLAKSSVIMMLIGVEGTSIIENAAAWGVPIPNFLSKYLIQIRERVNNGQATVENIDSANVVNLDKESGSEK